MTDTIDVAALVERLTDEQISMWRNEISEMRDAAIDDSLADEDPALFDNATGDLPLGILTLAFDELAANRTALQSQADALAEARRERDLKDKMWLYECEKHSQWLERFMAEKARATTAEASLATMREALEAMVQRFELYAGPGDMHAGHHDLELLKIARAALAKEGK